MENGHIILDHIQINETFGDFYSQLYESQVDHNTIANFHSDLIISRISLEHEESLYLRRKLLLPFLQGSLDDVQVLKVSPVNVLRSSPHCSPHSFVWSCSQGFLPQSFTLYYPYCWERERPNWLCLLQVPFHYWTRMLRSWQRSWLQD